MNKAVPQLMPIIRELDNIVKEKYDDKSVAIIDENGRVHMAHMDIHYGYSVNGVAYLHTEILKKNELNNFFKIYPEKFNNKTNAEPPYSNNPQAIFPKLLRESYGWYMRRSWKQSRLHP